MREKTPPPCYPDDTQLFDKRKINQRPSLVVQCVCVPAGPGSRAGPRVIGPAPPATVASPVCAPAGENHCPRFAIGYRTNMGDAGRPDFPFRRGERPTGTRESGPPAPPGEER
ncbi:hypothetical protein RR46_02373 [Papilio xuthus]|uniref:Uncharacterized protein n=1 Tax=Papilio xuthus TaxID=66420 RepID=A0A194Q0S6_PAPXU|nr:hypothetical protein RR46_02373 [Papilio xuthus]